MKLYCLTALLLAMCNLAVQTPCFMFLVSSHGLPEQTHHPLLCYWFLQPLESQSLQTALLQSKNSGAVCRKW